MKYLLFALFVAAITLVSCKPKESAEEKGKTMSIIDDATVKNVCDSLIAKYGAAQKFRIERGVKQAAEFWFKEDGTKEEFTKFCKTSFIGNDTTLDKLFNRLQTNLETLYGHFNNISLNLRWPLDIDEGEILPIDEVFGGYSPSAHLMEDFFKNKIAFHVLLNFPHYSLIEKTANGDNWSRKQWAYARMGDVISSRVPADLNLKFTETLTKADSYISGYNIYAGYLVDNSGKTLFKKELKLISHWNLRDELKTHYDGTPEGLEKQKMIYEVMLHIIKQDIPEDVINSNKYQWNPYKNVVLNNGKEIKSTPEPNTRYEFLLNNFKVMKELDPYCPYYQDYISRKFDEEMEIPQKEVEDLFIKLVSSPTIKKTGELIAKRLGRKLEPWDIWYDGFKSRSGILQAELDAKTKAKYPNKEAVSADLPNILTKLGFTKEKAKFITERVEVDPSRGAGHAAGAQMKSDKAHLRTRIAKDGMDYKGYNIAVHEFGHNTEQTMTLQNVDYYMLNGVPNTAFTEAWAFAFQKRDLELLGIKETNKDKDYLYALDNLWSTYEIMGVSLVDMNVWKWLYANPKATPEELKNQVLTIAMDVWNKYYAPVFGIKDTPILGIYSHMIDYPLYLSAYPIGHLIEFQVAQFIKDKNMGTEMERMCVQGRLIPEVWMKKAVGNEISIKPTLDAAEEAMLKMK